MAWTTPTIRATGYLVTASDWNTDIVNNLAYLKGQAGNVEYEDDIVPDSGAEKVGLSTAPWDEGHYDKLFAGPRCALHKFIREVTFEFMDISAAAYQITDTVAGGGDWDDGGSGQMRLKVDDDGAGHAFIENKAEQNSALDTSFNAGRSPYMRVEFAINNSDPAVGAFIGFRDTPGAALPDPSVESYAGLVWGGTNWVFQNGDGAGNSETSGPVTINDNTRYVIEILIISATSVEYYLNGVLVDTTTTGLPTGDLEWTLLLESAGGGGGGDDSILTHGKIILQEDLS